MTRGKSVKRKAEKPKRRPEKLDFVQDFICALPSKAINGKGKHYFSNTQHNLHKKIGEATHSANSEIY